MTARARRSSAVIAAAAIATGLGACSLGPTPEDQAQLAVQTFLDELAAGNATAALDLSTSSRDDFACPVLTEDTDDGLLVNPAAGEATVEGDTATVDAEYFATPDGATELTFTAERTAAEWLVVLPDAYRIDLAFDAPTIAVVDIERVTGNAGPQNAGPHSDCQITVTNGHAQTLALPGTYLLNLTDPSGVFAADRFMTAEVGGPSAPIELPAVDPDRLEFLSRNVSIELGTLFLQCVYEDFDPSLSCPEGTEGVTVAGDPTQVHDALLETDPFTLDQVWTEDERTWLFTTVPLTFNAVRDGEEVPLEVSYSGQLADNDGELEIILD